MCLVLAQIACPSPFGYQGVVVMNEAHTDDRSSKASSEQKKKFVKKQGKDDCLPTKGETQLCWRK